MSLLKSVTSGKNIGPQIHVVAGDNGVGKTTFAGSFPNSLILDLEDGSNHLDVARIKKDAMPDFASVRAVLAELASSSHTYKTVVIDSVEALEGLIFDSICAEGKVDSIEKYEGGYGKGYARSRELMREVMGDLQALKAKGITSVIVAHTQIKTKTDPAANQSYDRVIIRANDKLAAIVRDLADNVFYCTCKVFTVKEGNRTKAFGEGVRVMYTQPRPGFDAKNRLELPYELPLSYDAFAEACTQKPAADASALITEIKAMAEGLDDKMKGVVAQQIEKFKTNPTKLQEVKTRLMTYVAA